MAAKTAPIRLDRIAMANPISGKRLVLRILAPMGSLKLAMAILPLLGVGVVIGYRSETHVVWWLVIPMAACACNLLAAIATNEAFRLRLPLLVFHLALLALIVLIAVGRLTHLTGKAEVVEGGAFEGNLVDIETGPWHTNRLNQVKFVNEGFSIDYAPGLQRGATRNTLSYVDENGVQRRTEIGDNQPLIVLGYRFYTSFNKGFAPILRWHPQGAREATVGAVHLPAYPLHEYEQAKQWTLPGSGLSAWVMLQFDEKLIDPEKADQFKIPGNHTLILRIGNNRWELQPGDSADIPGGRLEYEGLRGWMGYTVFYDWTIPWLLAACLAAIAALGTHFWRKHLATPW